VRFSQRPLVFFLLASLFLALVGCKLKAQLALQNPMRRPSRREELVVVDTPHDLNPQHVEIILGSLHDSAFRSIRTVKWNYKDPKDELVSLGATGKIATSTPSP
jgi:hypothetical protein